MNPAAIIRRLLSRRLSATETRGRLSPDELRALPKGGNDGDYSAAPPISYRNPRRKSREK